jgi:hypothetical protein
MDKSTKAVSKAEKRLRQIEAALAASPRHSNERGLLVFTLMDAEREHRATLRAAKTAQVICSRCQRKLKPNEPMVWRPPSWCTPAKPVCLRCYPALSSNQFTYPPASELADLEQRPCETCARTMYLERRHLFHAHSPLTCSYQCNYRRKLKRQLERKRVKHETMKCAGCGEMFEPRRNDANTCSNRCRQKVYRERRAAERMERNVTGAVTKSADH